MIGARAYLVLLKCTAVSLIPRRAAQKEAYTKEPSIAARVAIGKYHRPPACLRSKSSKLEFYPRKYIAKLSLSAERPYTVHLARRREP